MNRVQTAHRGGVMMAALKTVILAMVFTAAAIALLALFITYGNISSTATDGCITAATILSVFLAGFATARKRAGAGWLSGLAAGLCYVVIMLAAGFLAFGSAQLGADTLKMLALAVVSGTAGGIAGVNFKRKRK